MKIPKKYFSYSCFLFLFFLCAREKVWKKKNKGMIHAWTCVNMQRRSRWWSEQRRRWPPRSSRRVCHHRRRHGHAVGGPRPALFEDLFSPHQEGRHSTSIYSLFFLFFMFLFSCLLMWVFVGLIDFGVKCWKKIDLWMEDLGISEFGDIFHFGSAGGKLWFTS